MVPVWLIALVVLAFTAPSCGDQSCNSIETSSSEWKLQCPTFSVNLKRHENGQLQVRCSNNRTNFGLLRAIPNLPKLTFNELDYSSCPMPNGDESLVDMLAGFIDREQVSNIEKLFFVDCKKHSKDAPLEPALFANLSKLVNLSMKQSAVSPLNNPLLFASLTKLELLDLRGGDGGSIAAGSLLHPLTNLHTLELMENGLTELPVGLVSNLPELRSLTLYKNKLQRLDKFVQLPALQDIDLSDNELTELGEDVFVEVPALTDLVLSLNQLSSLPGRLLRNNGNLTTFTAGGQRSTRLVLGDGLFAGLKHLEHVVLSDCQIAELPAGLFAGATGLKILDLRNNLLHSLPAMLLRDLSSLQELYLSHNALLHSLPDTLLQGTQQLRLLDLAHNNLTTLNPQLLKSKSKLKQLYLEYNQLHEIDLYAFEDQSKSLTNLNLNHNRVALHVNGQDVAYINGTPYLLNRTPFNYLNSVEILDLSYNEIVTVFNDFALFMPNLIRLNLSHNRIARFGTNNFPFSAKHAVIDLQSNDITQLDFQALGDNFDLTQVILLDDNPLRCDCLVYPLVQFLRRNALAKTSQGELNGRCAYPPALAHSTLHDVAPAELICQLDTADKFCPRECICYKRPADGALLVNCNGQNLTVVPDIPSPTILPGEGYHLIELNLANNNLQDLSVVAGEGWNSVRQLIVANNSLTTLPYDSLPDQLEVIDVSGNRLSKFDPRLVRVLVNRTELRNISLSANPWYCDCDAPFLQFVSDNVARVTDFSALRCADGEQINSGTLNARCEYRTALIVVLSMVITLIAVTCLIMYWLFTRYHHEIKVWVFRHDRLRWLVAEEQIDQDKRYDAFISYSHKDEDFVVNKLMPRLEGEPMHFKLCWHVRDFMPGELISTQITKAVEESRRTIIVLSPNYIESVWGQMEFNTAYLQSVADKRNRVIPIIYEDIGDIETLDPELRAYLKTNTYVRWDDPWFWDKLRYAMPHPRRIKGAQASNNIRMASIDKLNLLQTATQMSTPSLESTPPIEHAPSSKSMPNGEPLASFSDPTVLKSVPLYTISNGKIDLQTATN